MIAVLMITYNRIWYTVQAFEALRRTGCRIIIIDNGSKDDTVTWLENYASEFRNVSVIYNAGNRGIAGAMNQFLEMTKDQIYVGKCDNDTICPPDIWGILLRQCVLNGIDIIQAAHAIDPAVWPATGNFEGFISGMRKSKDGLAHFHHFVGGSGIIFRRDKVMDLLPQTDWKLYGWRQWQRQHPDLVKAFSTAVSVELLDGGGRYEDYPEYYKETKRVK